MSTTNTSWPSTQSVNNLSLPSSPKLEPSGLTFVSDDSNTKWLFVVSDNGYLTKGSMNTSHTPPTFSWQTAHQFRQSSDKMGDYESVATTGKNEVMIGIEGDSSDVPYPIIARFNTSNTSSSNQIGDFSSSQWTLRNFEQGAMGGGAGMEALTFVPNGSYPSAWLLDSPLNPNRSSSYLPYYGGLFFAATQSECGVIFVYDLAQGNNQSHNTLSFKNLPTMVQNGFPKNSNGSSVSSNAAGPLQISDLYFEPTSKVLYVLYDESSGFDYLQALTLNTSDGSFTQKWAVRTPYLGCEGVAVYGNDLYLAVDLSSSQTGNNPVLQDGVYQFPSFITTMNNAVAS